MNAIKTIKLLLLSVWLGLFFQTSFAQQDTIYYQGWEPSITNEPGRNGFFGWEQYNNATFGQQNVWGRYGFNGINGGGKRTFRETNKVLVPCDVPGVSPLWDSCAVAERTAYRGRNGAHIITGAVIKRQAFNDTTSKVNSTHTGYHAGPWCGGPSLCAGQTAATSVGLYSPKLLANDEYTQIRVEFWMKVNGQLNRDYGKLRYSIRRDAPQPPLADGLGPSDPAYIPAPDNYWKDVTYPVNAVARLDRPILIIYPNRVDTVRSISLNPHGSTIPGQLQGMVVDGVARWVRVSVVLPDECAADTNLRICFWWTNDNDGVAGFPALVVDDVLVLGHKFAAGTLSVSSYCPGESIEVPFRISTDYYRNQLLRQYPGDSAFALMLTDSLGRFVTNNPIGIVSIAQMTTIGKLTQGVVQGRIPVNLPQLPIGGYRVRLVGMQSRLPSAMSPTVISIFPQPTVTIEPKIRLICPGARTQLVAKGGGNFRYRWYRNGIVIPNANDSVYTTVEAGQYRVEVIRTNMRCLVHSDTAVITVRQPLNVRLNLPSSQKTVCYLQNIESLTGGSPANGRYVGGERDGGSQWVYRDNKTGNWIFNSRLAGVGQHVIFYESRDEGGCVYRATDTITVLPAPIGKILDGRDSIPLCSRGTVVLSTQTRADRYLWSPGGETTPTINVTTPGTYKLTLTDNNGCSYTTEPIVIVGYNTILPPPRINTVPPIVPGDLTVSGKTSLGVFNPTTRVYVYLNGSLDVITTPDSRGNWTATLSRPVNPGDRITARTLIDTNCDGVVSIDSDQLTADSPAYFVPEEQIPNGFSPNNDGKNDTWVTLVRIRERYPNNELRVYNRWGNLVYEKAPYDNTWNGESTDGERLPDGTYYYTLDLKLEGREVYKGYVTILR